MEIGGDDYYGGWRLRTLGICASCVAVLALVDVAVRLNAVTTAALIPPMLICAGTLLRGRPLTVILTLSMADLPLMYGLAPASSKIPIVVIGVIAVAAAAVGVWLRRFSGGPAHSELVGRPHNGKVVVTGRLHQPQSAEQPDGVLAQRLAHLSRREQDVARLVLDGLPTREIAGRLFISERTVETHLANIFDKIEVHSRGELVDSLLNRRSPNGKPRPAGEAHPDHRSRRS
jgi:DNA-binding CsgD family transcriptional regulator